MNQGDTDNTMYKVVVNHEEQYSIWVANRSNPPRLEHDAAKSGSKSECLAFIKEMWTDMRPLTLRKKMEKSDLAVGKVFFDLNEHETKTGGTD